MGPRLTLCCYTKLLYTLRIYKNPSTTLYVLFTTTVKVMSSQAKKLIPTPLSLMVSVVMLMIFNDGIKYKFCFTLKIE